MNGIDQGIYEAALIDGAGFLQTLLRVTVPSIRFAVEFWVVFNFIEVFARMFSLIYTLTRGGPGYGTFTLEYGIFVQAFEKFRAGTPAHGPWSCSSSVRSSPWCRSA